MANWILTTILRNSLNLLRSLVPRTMEHTFSAFNANFWSGYRNERSNAGFLLVEQQANPIINHCNASFAAIVCHAKGLRPLYLLNFWRDQSVRRILDSYAAAPVHVYTNGPRYLWPRLVALTQAWRVFRTLRNPADILDIRIDGIKFGDIVYDNVLVLGYATITRIDIKVFAVIYALHVQRHIIRDIIARFHPVTSVFSHTIGLVSGIHTRYLLRDGIEVLNRVGSNQIILKKYRSLSEVGFYPLKPEPRYFRFMREHAADTMVGLADAYLDERHNQRINHIAVELAFDPAKRLFKSRREFCDHYRLNPEHQIVFVMLHGFNDHPHSHFARRMLYQDYYDWFAKTLAVAQSNREVNWIFKEHPASQFYITKDVDLEKLFSSNAHPHIRFMGSLADFNALSIHFVADAIITCLGTAGMEYACVGIPCLLAGESPYSGFDFAIEPQSVAEYEGWLQRIDYIPKLNEEQIKSAKIAMFFELAMMQDSPYLFCPEYGAKEVMELKPEALWRDVIGLIQRQDPAALESQIEELTEFVLDERYTQYLNLRRYPFMKDALRGD